MNTYTKSSLNKLKKNELLEIAKEFDLKGISNKVKSELIKLILKEQSVKSKITKENKAKKVAAKEVAPVEKKELVKAKKQEVVKVEAKETSVQEVKTEPKQQREVSTEKAPESKKEVSQEKISDFPKAQEKKSERKKTTYFDNSFYSEGYSANEKYSYAVL